MWLVLASRIPELYQLGLCLRSSPGCFCLHTLGKLAGGFETPLAGARGWQPAVGKQRHSPSPSTCHTWSALAGIDFPLRDEGPGSRSCRGRTTAAYLSLPTGLGSCCLAPQTQQDSLHITSAPKMVWLHRLFRCISHVSALSLTSWMVSAQGFVVKFWKSPEKGMNSNGEDAWPNTSERVDPLQIQAPATASLPHGSCLGR